jgi:hypothetical protein
VRLSKWVYAHETGWYGWKKWDGARLMQCVYDHVDRWFRSDLLDCLVVRCHVNRVNCALCTCGFKSLGEGSRGGPIHKLPSLDLICHETTKLLLPSPVHVRIHLELHLKLHIASPSMPIPTSISFIPSPLPLSVQPCTAWPRNCRRSIAPPVDHGFVNFHLLVARHHASCIAIHLDLSRLLLYFQLALTTKYTGMTPLFLGRYTSA